MSIPRKSSIRLATGVAVILGFATVTSCESGPRPTQKPETDLVGEPPPERPIAKKATAQKSAPVDQTPVEDEVRVELVMLEVGNPYVTESGVRISLESKNPATIAFESADVIEDVSIGSRTPYAEGRVFEATWSFTRDGGMHLEWRPDPVDPLTPEQARRLAERELDANLGCEGELVDVASYPGTITLVRSNDDGVACSATVGIFTHRVVTP